MNADGEGDGMTSSFQHVHYIYAVSGKEIKPLGQERKTPKHFSKHQVKASLLCSRMRCFKYHPASYVPLCFFKFVFKFTFNVLVPTFLGRKVLTSLACRRAAGHRTHDKTDCTSWTNPGCQKHSYFLNAEHSQGKASLDLIGHTFQESVEHCTSHLVRTKVSRNFICGSLQERGRIQPGHFARLPVDVQNNIKLWW